MRQLAGFSPPRVVQIVTERSGEHTNVGSAAPILAGKAAGHNCAYTKLAQGFCHLWERSESEVKSTLVRKLLFLPNWSLEQKRIADLLQV